MSRVFSFFLCHMKRTEWLTTVEWAGWIYCIRERTGLYSILLTRCELHDDIHDDEIYAQCYDVILGTCGQCITRLRLSRVQTVPTLFCGTRVACQRAPIAFVAQKNNGARLLTRLWCLRVASLLLPPIIFFTMVQVTSGDVNRLFLQAIISRKYVSMDLARALWKACIGAVKGL